MPYFIRIDCWVTDNDDERGRTLVKRCAKTFDELPVKEVHRLAQKYPNRGFSVECVSGVECLWCLAGDDRVPSSVSDAWVHPATSVGRVVCRQGETPAQRALMSLAAFVGTGGYNSPHVDAKEFEAKIRDGIETLVRVARGDEVKF